MKRILFLAASVAALALTSCKKDKVDENNTDPGGPGTPGTPQETTKLLKKITRTDGGKTTIYTLNYDSQKKLISYNTSDNSEQIIFTYDESGNVVKSDETNENFHNIYSYTYNNGIPVSATFKSYDRKNGSDDQLNEDDELTYTVEGGKVTKILLKMKPSNEELPFVLTYNNGNVTKIETEGSNVYTALFAYGTHKPGFPVVYKYAMDQAGFSLHFFAKNEILTESYDFPDTQFDTSSKTDYTYDDKGYVLTAQEGSAHFQFDYQ